VDEDLVVPGGPPLVVRRTYLSGYRRSTQFGVGATHDGEWYLIGDGQRFQWAELILATGSRVRFERVSAGTTILNAKYEYRSGASEWRGAVLTWAWVGWLVRRQDGSTFMFRPCGPKSSDVCSIVQSIDADGRTIHYRRDASGRLLKMESDPGRWIAFDYDAESRITRAYDQAGREVRYAYDAPGRLIRVAGLEGTVHLYSYTARDELATIIDPGTTIENAYDEDGRCFKQVNRYPDDPDPFIFEFTYRTLGSMILQTDSKRSDGTWRRYTFGKGRATTSEAFGKGDLERVSIAYERDPATNDVTHMTVTCLDRTGRPLRHSSFVAPGREERIKRDLLETHCQPPW
jgi:YD repeat-containing protein